MDSSSIVLQQLILSMQSLTANEISSLLKTRKIFGNKDSNAITCVRLASMVGNVDALAVLLCELDSLDTCDNQFPTPIELACTSDSNIDCVKLLINHCNVNENIRSNCINIAKANSCFKIQQLFKQSIYSRYVPLFITVIVHILSTILLVWLWESLKINLIAHQCAFFTFSFVYNTDYLSSLYIFLMAMFSITCQTIILISEHHKIFLIAYIVAIYGCLKFYRKSKISYKTRARIKTSDLMNVHNVRKQICLYCFTLKTDDNVHCEQCKACVFKPDGHVNFIGTCIEMPLSNRLQHQTNNPACGGLFDAHLIAAIQHNEEEVDGILSARQLKRLKEHKYKSSGSSLLEPLFQPFWEWVVTKVPLYVAPNLLTMIGLMCNLITSILLFYYCPTAKEQPPRFLLFLASFGLFLYQTLDAIDGKQARRTNSSSPLGELFDHGCDTLSCVLLIGSTCVCLRLGYWSWFMMSLFMVVLSAFYIAHWQAYVTGELKFGSIDVTEAQTGMIFLQLLCSIVGTEWLVPTDQRKNIVSFLTTNITNSPAIVIALIVMIGTLHSLLTNLSYIPEGGVGINGSSIADSSIVFPGFQLGLVTMLTVVIARKSPTQIFKAHPIFYLITFGLVWCKYTNRLIIAFMSRSNVRMYDTILTGPIFLLLNQYFSCFIKEFTVLVIASIYCSFDLARYNIRVCREIASSLNICVFRLGNSTANDKKAAKTKKAN